MELGLVQQNMGRPDASDELTPEKVNQQIQMPPELQQAYERVVLAGMKMMFSKDSHKLMLKELQRGGPIAERLGNSIAGLMLMLWQQSNETMPPQVIIPAGTNLLVQAADFIQQSGLEQISNKDVGDGLQLFMQIILEKFGVDPQKLVGMIDNFDKSQIPELAEQQGV